MQKEDLEFNYQKVIHRIRKRVIALTKNGSQELISDANRSLNDSTEYCYPNNGFIILENGLLLSEKCAIRNWFLMIMEALMIALEYLLAQEQPQNVRRRLKWYQMINWFVSMRRACRGNWDCCPRSPSLPLLKCQCSGHIVIKNLIHIMPNLHVYHFFKTCFVSRKCCHFEFFISNKIHKESDGRMGSTTLPNVRSFRIVLRICP